MTTFLEITQKLRPYILEVVRIIFWFFIIASLVIFSVHSLISVSHTYSLDYGEAPLIDQAMRLSEGKNIYRADISIPPYTIANYPPLYVVSLIPFLDWFDSPFHMGRMVSVIASLFSSVFIGLTIQALSKDRLAAFVAAAFFLASPYVVQWSGLARIDSLALAFAMGAIFVFARWPRFRGALFGGGLLLIAAAFTRQSYALAAPLAAFVWLWTLNKRKAITLALWVGGLGIALFLLLNLITEGGFFYNIVTANVNEFGWERLQDHLTRLWEDAYIILLLGGLFLLIGWRKNYWSIQNPWPLLGAFLTGAFASAMTIGKIGSNINYFLELAAALALIAGIMIVWTRSYPWWNALAIFLISIQFGLFFESTMLHSVDWILTPRRLDFNHLQLLEQEVKRMDDPILADEYMGMLTSNERSLYLQPFEVSQLANAKMWDQQPILDDISTQTFDGILIHHFSPWPLHRERWTPEMLAEIDDAYRPAKTLAGTVIYIPRGESEISRVPEATQRSGNIAAPVLGGQSIPISEANFMAEPSIAINPTDPNHLIAITTSTSKQKCELPNCIVELNLFSSKDGGESWQLSATLSRPQQVMHQGQVAFNTDGTLNILANRNDVVVLNRVTVSDDYVPAQVNFNDVTRAQVNARPWLRVHPLTDELFLSFDPQEADMLFVTPGLIRSKDGLGWSTTTRTDQRVSYNDIFSPRATGPRDIQVLFGEGKNVSLVWVWDPEPWGWPRTVWMANSEDGGVTFGEPTSILKTWGPINSASANGVFAIVYRTGTEEEQQLAVATTSNQGRSWNSTIASGSLPLHFEGDRGPGIGIAPNGTIDLVFYVRDGSSDEECLQNIESWQQTLPFGRIDPCEYDVYYTYSNAGGLTFVEPVKLNDQPIRGEDFLRFNGASQVGSHLSVASSDDFAYPIWIGTPSLSRTQVYGLRIGR